MTPSIETQDLEKQFLTPIKYYKNGVLAMAAILQFALYLFCKEVNIVGQKSNDTSIHSRLPFNEKSPPGKNKDIQVYIRMSTKIDINLRMVTLMSS